MNDRRYDDQGSSGVRQFDRHCYSGDSRQGPPNRVSVIGIATAVTTGKAHPIG